VLHQYEKLVASALLSGAADVDSVCARSGLGRDSAVRALYWLSEKGFVDISEESRASFALGDEGKRFCGEGFPERRLLSRAAKGGVGFGSLSDEELKIGLPWAMRLGWVAVSVSNGGRKELRATAKGAEAAAKPYPPEEACGKLSSGAPLSPQDERELESLSSRGSIVVRRERSEIARVSLTEKGREALSSEDLSGEGEVNALSRELIVTGKWKEARIRGYDLARPVESVYPAKLHPLRRVIGRIREIFVELGFEEMEGGVIESSFWNFDALFQPQDHPARDLADTFYLSSPERIAAGNDEAAARVGKAHEKGWRYKWSREVSEQPVLRTHTTALSSRYVAETGSGKRSAPAKYFAVGRVYRNEATDFKHLAEFQQVEGIIVDENASFTDLLGTLRQFYSKLGFEKIRFRPHYFPYTEPSLEVDVFYEPKGEWMELGGAGIFRKEVCVPLWGKYPVLAWGLALERPAMIMMGLDDIRTFYRNDLGWLRKMPASRAGLG
jgi:phenylalanyl-tRNA synthetase alpha chain